MEENNKQLPARLQLRYNNNSINKIKQSTSWAAGMHFHNNETYSQ
jgi:hypothetical protein